MSDLPPKLDDPLDSSIEVLQRRLSAHDLSSREVTQHYLSRVHQFDGVLRSVIEVNPEALEIADALDAERARLGLRGPLHGIPILLKDNIGTADAMNTSAGSLALLGARPQSDSRVAASLRAAGAILLGKANMNEWSNFRSTHSTSGWSARGGQCRNPYVLDRSPSGSSSGSAVAVAASLCPAAIGTETNGSIVAPAQCCSVVGIKPTIDLVSREGVILISSTQDCPGPIARRVTDAALVLCALIGAEAAMDVLGLDPACSSVEEQLARAPTLAHSRLGVFRGAVFGGSRIADRVWEVALDELRNTGAELIDPIDLEMPNQEDELDVLLHEFRLNINEYLAQVKTDESPGSLDDLIEFNKRNSAHELVYFGQELFEMASVRGELEATRYKQAREETRAVARRSIDTAIAEHGLDAIVCPTGLPAPPIDLVNGDARSGRSGWVVPAVAGYPIITVPAGYAEGLPVGLSFIGSGLTERTLLSLAYDFENATKHRKPPEMRATIEPQQLT
jgi:amidase